MGMARYRYRVYWSGLLWRPDTHQQRLWESHDLTCEQKRQGPSGQMQQNQQDMNGTQSDAPETDVQALAHQKKEQNTIKFYENVEEILQFERDVSVQIVCLSVRFVLQRR